MTGRGCTVLVVDTDMHLRQLICDFLTDLGCKTEFFDDGYSALDHARLNPPALVITEVLVPRLDGLALSRLLKSDPELWRTKVLILTVLSAEERARQAGADAYVKKPIERRSLATAIRSLVQGNGLTREAREQ